jgi:hypothetical protein
MGIIHTTGPKLSKYGPLVPALRELILCPDTPLEVDVEDMIAAGRRPEAFTAIGHGHHHGDRGPSQPPAAQPGSTERLSGRSPPPDYGCATGRRELPPGEGGRAGPVSARRQVSGDRWRRPGR